MSRWISSVRPDCLPRAASRGFRSSVARGSIPYSAVIQPCPESRRNGGTRTAAITGAFVALHDALTWLASKGAFASVPLADFVAAVSVGVYEGTPIVDLDYGEDSACGCDMNVVMTGAGGFVEIQGTAERTTFSRRELDALLGLAERGIAHLVSEQRRALGLA